MSLPVMILKAAGTNCEVESKHAFEVAAQSIDAKVKVDIVHLNDLKKSKSRLRDYKVLMFPGGFSYGDDTGSGKAQANVIRRHLRDEMQAFIQGDNLALGVCNGFQVMVNLGMFPVLGGEYGVRQQALVHNNSARYLIRWVDVLFSGKSPWLQNLGREDLPIPQLMLPIAHGEGKFYAEPHVLEEMNKRGMVAGRYVSGEACTYQSLPANPTGTLENIAAVTDHSGRLLGMMPHPERAIDPTQLPNYTYLREYAKRRGVPLPKVGPGLQIFINAILYHEAGSIKTPAAVKYEGGS